MVGHARSLARQLRVMALVKEASMTTATTERPSFKRRHATVGGGTRVGTRCETFRNVLKLIRWEKTVALEVGSFLLPLGHAQYHLRITIT